MTFNDMIAQTRANNNSLVKHRVDMVQKQRADNNAVNKYERRFKIINEWGDVYEGDKDYIMDMMSRSLDGVGGPFAPDRFTLTFELIE